jgi:hypothetical protein
MDKNKIAHVDYLNYSQGDAAAQKNSFRNLVIL